MEWSLANELFRAIDMVDLRMIMTSRCLFLVKGLKTLSLSAPIKIHCLHRHLHLKTPSFSISLHKTFQQYQAELAKSPLFFIIFLLVIVELFLILIQV